MRINVHKLAMSVSSVRKDMVKEKAINYNYTYDITIFGIDFTKFTFHLSGNWYKRPESFFKDRLNFF